MPVVRVPGRQVSAAPLPGVRLQSAETPTALGAGVEAAKAGSAEALGRLGGGIAQAGTGLFADAAEEARKQADEIARLKWQNQMAAWQRETLYDPTNGAFAKQGEAAMGLPEQVDGQFKDLTNAIESGLGNDKQRLQFEQDASSTGNAVSLAVLRHTTEQIGVFHKEQAEARVQNAVASASVNAYDPQAVASELDAGIAAIRGLAQSEGTPAEAVQHQIESFTSAAHEAVVDRLLADGKDQFAKTYFDEVTAPHADGSAQSAITGPTLTRLEKAVEEGSLRGSAQQQADTIIKAGGPLSEQRDKVRAITDPKLRDAVQERVEHEASVQDKIDRDTLEANMTAAYNLVDRSGDVSSIPPAQWTALPGPARESLRVYAARIAEGVPVKTDMPTYYALLTMASTAPGTKLADGSTPLNSDDFLKLNLLTFKDKLSDGDFKSVAGIQASGRNKDAKVLPELAGFRTKDDLVNDTLVQYGIDPKAKDTATQSAVAELRRLLDLRVDAAQQPDAQGHTKKVTNTEIQQTLDDILSQSRTVPGSWWGLLPFSGASLRPATKRLIDLTPADVPPAERTQIEAALRRAQRPVTDQTVLDLYINGQMRKAASGR